MKTPIESRNYVVFGRVTYSKSGKPAVGVRVVGMDADLFCDDKLGEDKTDDKGQFKIVYGIAQFSNLFDLFERAPDIYLLVYDDKGRLLTTTRDSVIRNAGLEQEIYVQLPGSGSEPELPTIEVGGVLVNPHAFEKLEPETLQAIADFAIQGRGDRQIVRTIEELSPELTPDALKAQLSFTPLVRFLREAVRVKNWDREIYLRLEDIFIGYDPDASYATFSCSNFTITYETSGSDQPPSADTGGNIIMPGTGVVVGTTTAGNGVPDYIEKLCFWLTNALNTYTNPPFNLRNPASSGAIPVNVTGTAPGFAGGGSMTIGRNLNDDLLAAVPTHELMHLIQELYEGAGAAGGWNPGMVEGGAVLGEDVVFDTHNRYIVQATSPGILASPGNSLNSLSYYLAFFLKYISEQQSSRVNPSDEPTIGVETYRKLLETFDTDGYNTVALEKAVEELPWYQSFYKFGYLDAAKLDETNSETLLGNFWLACYLKDFGNPVQILGITERRFDFMEDEENATWDSIFLGADTVSTLGSVSLTTDTTLNSSGTITLSSGGGGSVDPFAARFYKVNIATAVDTLQVNFTAGAGFTRPLIQIVLVEPGNVVRDILRSDRTSWSRTIANARGGTNLDHISIVVAGTDVGGTFSLTVQEVSPAPDIMVTRWHHLAGTHYELDSFGWAWTWVSPDIWVDNDGNGMADSEVFFNQNNKLFIRLRNQGHANASGISVAFWYQSAAGGLSDAGWLPVQNTAFVTQTLTGLNLAAGTTNQWSVDWAPVPSGTSNHFCVKAVVTVPGDPNTDNKRCLSNFGNVKSAGPYIDLPLLRRIPERLLPYPPELQRVRIDVIPRTFGRWFVSAADLAHAETTPIKRGRAITDEFRIRQRTNLTQQTGHPQMSTEFLAKRLCPAVLQGTRLEVRPDLFGHYPTDPRALPPGLEKVPLITIVHVVDGKVMGGFTWAIREET
jgi:hypothetical protein